MDGGDLQTIGGKSMTLMDFSAPDEVQVTTTDRATSVRTEAVGSCLGKRSEDPRQVRGRLSLSQTVKNEPGLRRQSPLVSY